MLDADSVVIADHAQVRDHILPICVVVAVADGAEYPRAVNLVRIGLSVEHAVDGGVIFVYLRVLGVEMEDSVAERSYAQGKIYEKYKNKKTKRRPPFGERPSVMRGSMQLLASGLRRGDA